MGAQDTNARCLDQVCGGKKVVLYLGCLRNLFWTHRRHCCCRLGVPTARVCTGASCAAWREAAGL